MVVGFGRFVLTQQPGMSIGLTEGVELSYSARLHQLEAHDVLPGTVIFFTVPSKGIFGTTIMSLTYC